VEFYRLSWRRRSGFSGTLEISSGGAAIVWLGFPPGWYGETEAGLISPGDLDERQA